MAVESMNVLIGSRRRPRVSTVAAALVGLSVGYAVAVSFPPSAQIPAGTAAPRAELRAATDAEAVDNSRECDARAGITTACVY